MTLRWGVVGILALCALANAIAAEPVLSVDKTLVAAEEKITVTFEAQDVTSTRAWIGIVPASIEHGSEATNDRNDVDYRYLEGKKAGSFTFDAPGRPGKWEFRLNDGEGKEIAHVGFEVRQPDYSRAKLTLDGESYAPGAAIAVTFEAPAGLASNAWIGLLPAAIPHGDEAVNDSHDLTYHYFTGTSGTMSFTAPEKAGRYDFRMHSGDPGDEITHVAFAVTQPTLEGAKLTIAKTAFIPGERIVLSFVAPEGLSHKAWIGVVPAEIPHGDETLNDRHDLSYRYLRGRAEGELDFRAPTKGGEYTFRFNSSDSGGEEIASIPFTVSSEVAAEDMASQLEATGRVALYGIRFATNKATLDAESEAAIAQVAELLTQHPELAIWIEGHTDDVGDAAYNMELSTRRAESVKRQLVEGHGIAAERLSTKGFGETKPVADNETDSGRAQNRRVELAKRS